LETEQKNSTSIVSDKEEHTFTGVSIRRNKNYDKYEHLEAPLSLIPLDEDEVFQPCFPSACNVEEAMSLDGE
jgi:hypothetical protein